MLSFFAFPVKTDNAFLLSDVSPLIYLVLESFAHLTIIRYKTTKFFWEYSFIFQNDACNGFPFTINFIIIKINIMIIRN